MKIFPIEVLFDFFPDWEFCDVFDKSYALDSDRL